jgi:cytochrome c oxidase assembly protein subunit 19
MAAFNGNIKKFQTRAPEKGSFPLDHLRECSESKQLYMQCLIDNDKNIGPCRSLSLAYLNCRMDNDLMARESKERLGFADLEDKHVKQLRAPPTNVKSYQESYKESYGDTKKS